MMEAIDLDVKRNQWEYPATARPGAGFSK